ncbi:hypothetical protein HPB52_000790 [Rhipicephalus sanguineus]|uniref:Uncharacterized protein n=1 Tax=Rhipicephalus sanguineus TaxID=34632 RepID=A0A9D4PVY9_RHISA|nr:hypothetical protein HPB52_000790 [Rhipicephalus sanguineus]
MRLGSFAVLALKCVQQKLRPESLDARILRCVKPKMRHDSFAGQTLKPVLSNITLIKLRCTAAEARAHENLSSQHRRKDPHVREIENQAARLSREDPQVRAAENLARQIRR